MSIFRGPEGRNRETPDTASSLANLQRHLTMVSPDSLMVRENGVEVHPDTANTMEAMRMDVDRVLGGSGALHLEKLEFPKAA